ncbi:glycoside hydrolase family 125 protein [Karstenula rhodostoma CBS 690.94]|uniref:Glycoside hydrolase family 125 protein n=1 Tax=Karstenula rhodostoma CBS 690.94 TaxID=1392251 RepID=A0A9P4PL50_9PLEO|nr:glycoside hydrolase family 125 protein [Karstenula rhodostoma CBS 690.94]
MWIPPPGSLLLLTLTSTLVQPVSSQCPIYTGYAYHKHLPLSTGKWQLASMRPIPPCRTFKSREVEETIERLRNVIVDPDLFRLFENTWPSTLDTTVAWTGVANKSVIVELDPVMNKTVTWDASHKFQLTPEDVKKLEDEEEEELSFVITGDIEAMWLRDSANQLQAYTSVLRASKEKGSLASLFRGAINLQARYILGDPFCNAFQAPIESKIPRKSSANSDTISPSYDYMAVFSCQWELDSVASFLQLSADYARMTGDVAFFGKHAWAAAVRKVLDITQSMTVGSYDAAGTWMHTPYTYCAPYGGTPINDCNGSPHRAIGLVRSFHRPSDDSCIYQYLIPSNMMYAVALNASAPIMAAVQPHASNLTAWMTAMSSSITTAIAAHAVVRDPTHGPIFAYEIDGYGSAILMDDPNVPSLLSAPYLNFTSPSNPVYANTRRKILSRDNPYFTWGPVIEGVGSMHTLPGRAWPMANIMAILTSSDDVEIARHLRWLVQSTDGYGLMHESVHSQTEGVWSRQWFSWANGLFGQAILDLERRKPWILRMGFQ